MGELENFFANGGNAVVIISILPIAQRPCFASLRSLGGDLLVFQRRAEARGDRGKMVISRKGAGLVSIVLKEKWPLPASVRNRRGRRHLHYSSSETPGFRIAQKKNWGRVPILVIPIAKRRFFGSLRDKEGVAFWFHRSERKIAIFASVSNKQDCYYLRHSDSELAIFRIGQKRKMDW